MEICVDVFIWVIFAAIVAPTTMILPVFAMISIYLRLTTLVRFRVMNGLPKVVC